MVLAEQMDLTELMTMMMERPIIDVFRVRPLVLVVQQPHLKELANVLVFLWVVAEVGLSLFVPVAQAVHSSSVS